ncbi:MAG: lipopolysaccharide assembly protein LapA domain-containing protein [Deltaproteobacteria bacterium]
MVVLLIGVIFGIAMGYFATQNTTPVTIKIGDYAFMDIPLYLVIVGSLFVGLFVSWILYFARTVSSWVTIYGKNYAVRKARLAAADLEQRVQELEAENTHLRNDHHSSPFEPSHRTLS